MKVKYGTGVILRRTHKFELLFALSPHRFVLYFGQYLRCSGATCASSGAVCQGTSRYSCFQLVMWFPGNMQHRGGSHFLKHLSLVTKLPRSLYRGCVRFGLSP